MKLQAFRKDVWREIRKSRSRFFSIMMIVALGVAFFSGVRASQPDMYLTADSYMDERNLMDVRVVSTLGFSEDNVEAIRNLKGISAVEGSWYTDLLLNYEESEYVLQVIALGEMNEVEVTQGRLPVEENECLLDAKSSIPLGAELTFYMDADSDIEDTLTQETFTVVGKGYSPLYVSTSRGSTNIGDGSLDYYVIVPKESFVSEYYIQLYVQVEGCDELNCYSDEYVAKVEAAMDAIDAIAGEQGELHYECAIRKAAQEIEDGKQELADKKQEVAEELSDARAELDDGWQQYEDGVQELEDGRQQIAEAESEIAENEQLIKDGQAAISEAEMEISSKELEISAAKIALPEAEAQLAQGEATLKMLKALYPSYYLQIDSISQQIADTEAQIAEGKAQIAAYRATINDGEVQIAAAKVEIENKKQELADGQTALEEAKQQLEEAKKELEEGEAELVDAKEKLEQGELDYEEGKREAEEEFAKAEDTLAKAEDTLTSMESPTWYLFDRTDLPEYSDLGDNADRIGAIGKVFPLMFFLIAALVSLTTMTRMVDEQRTLIGTLKALGYSRMVIASKYIFYAFAATAFGSVIGVLIGEKLFPYIIVSSYGLLYHPFKNPLIPYEWQHSLTAAGAALVCTIGATMGSCVKTLDSGPAQLMRPAAPPQGKRILLEHITILWKHFSFSQKAAFRNLFRYKKRMLMTIAGISSCMGMMLVGFGIHDSIVNIGDIQFKQIQLEDAMLILNPNASEKEDTELDTYLKYSEAIEAYAPVYMKTVNVVSEESNHEAYICVTPDVESFSKFHVFRDRVSKTEYELTDDSVILTEKIAANLGVRAGDQVYFKSGDDSSIQVTVSAVCENYIYHYVYMSEACYEKIYGEIPDYGVYYLAFADEYADSASKIGKEILEHPAAYNITYTEDTNATLDSMLAALNLIVVVLIVSAGLLAFIVIFNLNNINITERRRELATLKVLGFFDVEVDIYIFRENIFLTLVGAAVGIGIGYWLHQYIIQTVEVSMVMFGREINTISYVYSYILTCLFSLLINGMMHWQLKQIDMIESLKSIE
ncbi:MAG: FtsX-like permease family protein [Lachnospiraceae bacterium]